MGSETQSPDDLREVYGRGRDAAALTKLYLPGGTEPHPSNGPNYMDAKESALFAGFWEALLSLDADEIARRFDARGSICFGNAAPAEGRQAVRREFVRLFARTSAIRHRPVSLWARDGVVVADSDLAFELDGQRHVHIPVTTVCWFRGDGIARCEFSFYPEPALAPVA